MLVTISIPVLFSLLCVFIMTVHYTVETGIDNDGFSTLPENVETKDTVMVARPLETSSVDMYENADQVPDVYINEIKQTIEVKSRNKNSGFRKEYSVSQIYIFFLIKQYHRFDTNKNKSCCTSIHLSVFFSYVLIDRKTKKNKFVIKVKVRLISYSLLFSYYQMARNIPVLLQNSLEMRRKIDLKQLFHVRHT